LPVCLLAAVSAACERAASAIAAVLSLLPFHAFCTASHTAVGNIIPPHQCCLPLFSSSTTPGAVTYSSFTRTSFTSVYANIIFTGCSAPRKNPAAPPGLWYAMCLSKMYRLPALISEVLPRLHTTTSCCFGFWILRFDDESFFVRVTGVCVVGAEEEEGRGRREEEGREDDVSGFFRRWVCVGGW
jgi:hypothetical protein